MLLTDHPDLSDIPRRPWAATHECCHGSLLTTGRVAGGRKTFVCACVRRPADRLRVAQVARDLGLLSEPPRTAL